MADGFVQVAPDSTGKKIDNSEITVGANTVERQRVNIADPTSATRIASVTAANALNVDGSAVTQPVSAAGLTNIDVALSTRLKPADTLAAVTAITNPVTANGDVDHDAVNTLKQIQVAGNANPVDSPPAAVSAAGDRVRAWYD